MFELPPLHPGDTIALVAPSFGCVIEPYLTRLDVSIKRLRKMGYNVVEGPNVRLALGVACSNTPEKRAEEIHDAFASDAKLVLSVGGGETMCEMLSCVDFEFLKKHPKWYMGFSDNTNLTFLLTTLCDMPSIYGPCAGSFFQKKLRHSEADAIALMQGKKTHFEGYPKWSISKKNENKPLASYRCTQPKIITPFGEARQMEGMFLGGCIDCLVNLCGTRFDNVKEFIARQNAKIIWYLEACDLNALDLRRAYFHLKEAGWFDTCAGFLLGRPLSAREEILGVDRFNAAIDILGGFGVPIWMDVDLGHLAPSMPIKNGALGTAKLENGNLIIDYRE